MDCLQEELPSQQFNTWIRPLRAETAGASIQLLAPNRFVKEWVHDKFLERISELINEIEPQAGYDVVVDIGGTGLYLEVRATSPGQGTYYLRWKQNGKTCHEKLGRTTDIELDEARRRAKIQRAERTLGKYPRM